MSRVIAVTAAIGMLIASACSSDANESADTTDTVLVLQESVVIGSGEGFAIQPAASFDTKVTLDSGEEVWMTGYEATQILVVGFRCEIIDGFASFGNAPYDDHDKIATLVQSLLDVPGINSLSIDHHVVSLVKGHAFSFEELRESLTTVLMDYNCEGRNT